MVYTFGEIVNINKSVVAEFTDFNPEIERLLFRGFSLILSSSHRNIKTTNPTFSEKNKQKISHAQTIKQQTTDKS